MKKYIAFALCALMLIPGCGTMSNTAKDSLIGAGGGAALGAVIGGLIGKDAKGAAIGAAIGTAVGGSAGAIKVTFSDGILFDFNKTNLKPASQAELKDFANRMSDMVDTDISVFGHTDNVGTAAANEKVSIARAESVANYLTKCGIAPSRIKSAGMSYNDPVASNDTAEGRAQNRRVEIYISANENMIRAAENGTLQ